MAVPLLDSFCSHFCLSFSVATAGDSDGNMGLGSERTKAQMMSKESRTHEAGTDRESVRPPWDQLHLPLSFIFVSICFSCGLLLY